jgi:DNA-binding MltR family transcriptional regulator
MNNVDIDKLESVYNSFINMLKNIGEENSHVLEELVKIEEYKNFRHSLEEESDRGSALMAAAFIEEKIGELLQLFCVDNKKIYTRLFENNGALATFSSKIDLAFLLGIIPKNIFDDLHLLRRIRNDFAHKASHITFESSPIKERCYSFSVLVKTQLRDHPRAYFLRAMTVILTFIGGQSQNLKKCTMVENFNTDTIEQMMKKVNQRIQKN